MKSNEIDEAVGMAIGVKPKVYYACVDNFGFTHIVCKKEGTCIFWKRDNKHLEIEVKKVTDWPEYNSNLNACRDIFSYIRKNNLRNDFGKMLKEIVHPKPTVASGAEWFYASSATAEQICEAFLRVKGLWKESA